MTRKRKKKIIRRFQATRYRETFLFKIFIFLALLTFSVIFLLYGLKNYREIDSYPLVGAKKVTGDVTGLRVRLLNSSGESDLTELLASKLKEYGITPVIEKVPGQYSPTPTMVINRSGDSEKIAKLASIIGCTNIVAKVEHNDMVDAVIIIGKDLRSLRK
ncbi:MAG: LytR C-terminal domain-containing protein [bacterium]|nr:LytR C-terminal domain-containing protein [bacterium]MDD5757293.1 LytR C-terminal domain-containing protein [bacterium]